MNIAQRLLVLVVACSIVVACVNTEWFLAAAYGRLDNMIYSKVEDYADFDTEQAQAIRARIDDFHYWHRVTQLPRYAQLLTELSSRAKTGIGLEPSEAQDWVQKIEDFVEVSAQCNPMLFGLDIMQSLSDTQVEQIAEHARSEFQDYLQQQQKYTDQQRWDKRYKEVITWLRRFQLDIKQENKQRLRDNIERKSELRTAGIELWQQWDNRFYELLLIRSEPEFADLMEQHLRYFYHMTEETYPQQVATERQHWVEFLFQIAQSEFRDSDNDFAVWADKMARNLLAIAQKIPKKSLAANATEYCAGRSL